MSDVRISHSRGRLVMSNIHPFFARTLDNFTGSHKLIAAAQSTRTPAEALAERTKALLSGPRWELWAIPSADEPFLLETTLTQATNERSALLHLIDQLNHDWTALVIHIDAAGKRHDVSLGFAAQWIRLQSAAGWSAEVIQRNRFVGTHFCDYEIEQLCKP